MRKEEELKKESTGETGGEKAENSGGTRENDWRSDLRTFLDDDNQNDDENSDDDKSSGESPRTKTLEPLLGWTAGRDLGSITREQIAGDFIAHYKDAVARLRAPMHDRQLNQQ